MLAPVIELLSTEKVMWTKRHAAVINSTVDYLLSATTLAAPDFEQQFTVQVNAGLTTAIAVLLQKNGPVCFASVRLAEEYPNTQGNG